MQNKPGRCIVCHQELVINEKLADVYHEAKLMFFCNTPGCCRQGLVTMIQDDQEPEAKT